MDDILKYSIAGLPVLLILFFVYKIDKNEKEQIWPLVITFLLGGLGTIPLLFWESWVSTTALEQNINIWKTLVIAFLVVAASEEFVKSLVVYLYPYHQSFFNERLDGIIYGATASLGFATVENFLYAYQYDWTSVAVRAFTGVPIHAAFGVIVGYYFGLAKFNKEKQWNYILRGLLIAIGLHGLYDFFIIQQINENLMGAALLVLGFVIWLAVEMVRKLRKKVIADVQTERIEEPQNQIKNTRSESS